MKKLFLAGLLLGSLNFAHAVTITAPLSGSGALNGNYAYLWSIGAINLPANQSINSATITFTGVKETAGGNGNDISVDFGTFVGINNYSLASTTANAKVGTPSTTANTIKTVNDGDKAGDAFKSLLTAGKAWNLGTELFPSLNVVHTWSYTFTQGQLDKLISVITGNWGFEIDPDCHFDLTSICFTYTTITNKASVPDTATTFGLLGMSLLGLVAFRRKFCAN